VGLLFACGLLVFYAAFMRRRPASSYPLITLLWWQYLALGGSAALIALSGVLQPVYAPNYLAALFLLTCVAISALGFRDFRSHDVAQLIGRISGQRAIENVLICSQLLAIGFFAPFAIDSLTGDVHQNRLLLDDKMEVMGSYGLINTAAGAATQLFSSSLVMAFIRLAPRQGRQRSVARAVVLVLSSLSYVVYILAYVGRDGVVYWLMTAAMVLAVFWIHLTRADRMRIVGAGALISVLLLVPFLAITIARFLDTEHGAAWSFLEYFGAQIHHFSDYSSIDRPLTLGVLNFPMFIGVACSTAGLQCESWPDIKELIFSLYLAQDKEPWLFGTFVSDFVADFGYLGAFVLVCGLALLSHRLCTGYRRQGRLTLARLLLILFVFLIPFWGVFYFRFSIANGFIVVNLLFIGLVALLQKWGPAGSSASSAKAPRSLA